MTRYIIYVREDDGSLSSWGETAESTEAARDQFLASHPEIRPEQISERIIDWDAAKAAIDQAGDDPEAQRRVLHGIFEEGLLYAPEGTTLNRDAIDNWIDEIRRAVGERKGGTKR